MSDITASDITASDITDTGTVIDEAQLSQERRDLLQTLRTHRRLFRQTTMDLTDEQARTRSTVSALTVGGLIKHVAETEDSWARFAVEGPEALGGGWDDVDWSVGPPPEAIAAYDAGFTLLDDETLTGWLDEYDAVAARTDALVATIDLDAAHPLPDAPWFESGASWTARRVFAHIIAETAQHAGHADIIRESIDGAKTMG